MASSSCFPSNRPQWTYDAFLSFRGEDTRKGFTDHLYNALEREGIYTFRDDKKLERGTSISEKLHQGIEESRIAVVVFSKNFASSTWCLDELLKIVECKNASTAQTVLPVFYDVGPSEIRKQSGSFAEAFDKHERSFEDSLDKVQRWRAALAQIGNISGFHLQDRHETEFIQEIVKEVASNLDRTPPSFSKDLVGIGYRVHEIMKLCTGIKEKNDVGFIGIWGMGGIGKTTLARCFRDKVAHEFDDISCLENVREVSADRGGLVNLQEKLLSDLQINIGTRKWNAISKVQHRALRQKKVLIILDDVDQSKQLDALAGSHDWFGRGSRIIITTRNGHLLTVHGVDVIYEAQKLKHDEALQLFCWKAFKNRNQDMEKYMELSHSFVKYAQGLPLAVEVLGRSLYGRSLLEWESAYTRNKGNLENEVMSVLLIGFDALCEEEKQIFLDIACFFKGKDRARASMVLESFGFFPDIGIRVLIDKCLIAIVEGRLWMHDLVQEMGWKIIRQECPNEPGKWSRLWHWEDVLNVLKDYKGTDAVEGIVLNLPHKEKVELNRDAFSKMKKLRYLKISDVLLPQGLSYLSTDLGFFEWHGYPSKLLPPNFPSGKLVYLNMHCGYIKHLWKGMKALEKLKSIELIDSKSLMETPDFTGVPNLERLILKGCLKLYKVHPSIGTLKRLVLLNLENCKSLERLPDNISLGSLETFILSGCARLKRFPEIPTIPLGHMGRLWKLCLDGTAIQDLPSSIGGLSGLSLLDLTDCRNLLRLPDTISSLISLKNIILSGCTSLEEIPEGIGGVESLEELDISGSAIRQIPSAIVRLKNLKMLSCGGCKGQLSSLRMFGRFPAVCPGMGLLLPSSFLGLTALTSLNLSDCNLLDGGIPDDLGHLSSLRDLNLIGNNFTSIPESISQLSKLTELLVRNCSKLQSLPKLPISVQRISADGCTSLRSDSDQYEVWNSWHSAKEQYLYIIKRSRSHTYGIVLSALRFVEWLQRDNHEVAISQPLRPKHGFSSGVYVLPNWFENQSSSSSVTIQLPRKSDSKSRPQWIGYALYVCCEVDEKFDTRCAFKVMHKFDFYLETNRQGHLLEKKTLVHEINVTGIPFTGPNGYWLYTTHAWFSQQLNALNECTSIEAYTKTDIPGVEVKTSGARLLFDEKDFVAFIESVTANSWVPLISRNCGSCSTSTTHLLTWEEESQGSYIGSRSTLTLKERLEALPLQSYESRKTLGGRKYIVQGFLDNPQIASTLGEILLECSGETVFYTTCFPQCNFPEWFFRDIGGSDLMKGWKGIAVCISFKVHGPRTLALANWDIKYILQTNTGLSEERIHHVTESTMSQLIRLKQRDFVWITYTSRGSFPEYTWNQCISMNVVYNNIIEDLRVHKCGYQLVFNQSMEGCMDAIMQCSTTSESKNFKNEGLIYSTEQV